MKRYLIIANLDRGTNAYGFFEGKSLDDPEMRENIMKWLAHNLNEGEYNFDCWLDDGYNQKITDGYGIKIYQIAEGPMLIPDIWNDFKLYLEKLDIEMSKEILARDKAERQRQYEQLKKEFEK